MRPDVGVDLDPTPIEQRPTGGHQPGGELGTPDVDGQDRVALRTGGFAHRRRRYRWAVDATAIGCAVGDHTNR